MSRNLLLAAAAGMALSGCASLGKTAHSEAAPKAADPALQDWQTTASIAAKTKPNSKPAKISKSSAKAAAKIDAAARAAVSREDALTQMTFWAGEHSNFPDDVDASINFAEALRKGGRAERAVEVANEALAKNPDNRPLLRTYGLALIASGRPMDAMRPLTMVAQADPADWRTRSSLGVALDEQGRFEEARQSYKQALALKPADPGVLTNLGVSYLMEGKAAEAETILKQAAALPNAGPEARQNLAMAVGLQGRFSEAEQLQKVDLPPALVANNMAYLRGLITDDRRWGDMKKTSNQ
jgi:Flp pilus assembly protein TadD